MADQLLSQADIDALVSSLTKNEPAVSESASEKPATIDSGLKGGNTATSKTSTSTAAPECLPVKPVTAPVKPSVMTSKPAPSPMNTTRSTLPKNIIGARTVSISRQEQKTDTSTETLNSLNAKIAGLTDQITKMGASLKRLEILEKKVIDLEIKLEKSKQSQELLHRVNQLSEEYKKLTINLKGTPGYGVRHSFVCEKCNDKGHVAQMFRCTSCGQERWYGWWPNK